MADYFARAPDQRPQFMLTRGKAQVGLVVHSDEIADAVLCKNFEVPDVPNS